MAKLTLSDELSDRCIRELKAVEIVWRRELYRFTGDRLRIATSLVQPFLFLFVIGSGLTHLTRSSTGGVNYSTILYPGVLGLAVMLATMFACGSLVWDREFGFIREMLVAPVSASSIIGGKSLGAATVGALQGLIIIASLGTSGLTYGFSLILGLVGCSLLFALVSSALGLLMAVSASRMQSFIALSQLLVMPMFFISGAIFPISDLPAWLSWLNKIDPLTYVLDPMRHVVVSSLHLSTDQRLLVDPGISWLGHRLSLSEEVGISLLLSALFLGLAGYRFRRLSE